MRAVLQAFGGNRLDHPSEDRRRNKSRRVKYGLAISEEVLGDGAPVLLQGGLERAMFQARTLGFESVEMHIRNPGEFHADRILELAGNLELTVSAIGTGLEYTLNGLSFTSPDPAVRERSIQRFKEHIDLAAPLGAVVFLGLCRGRAPSFAKRQETLDLLAETLVPIAAYGEKRGVVLGFEPIAMYLTNLLTTTQDTLDFLKRPGLSSLQLLLDTHHIFLEDRDLEASFRQCRGRIAHVHISDSNRLSPGYGNVDWRRVGKVLKSIDYAGSVSLEVLPFPDSAEAAQRGLKWMRSVWGD